MNLSQASGEFECAITAEGRVEFASPILFWVGVIGVPFLLGLAGHALGSPETLASGVTVLVTLIGLGIWYLAFGKGERRMAPDGLVVKPLWRSAVEVQRSLGAAASDLAPSTGSGASTPVGLAPSFFLQRSDLLEVARRLGVSREAQG